VTGKRNVFPFWDCVTAFATQHCHCCDFYCCRISLLQSKT